MLKFIDKDDDGRVGKDELFMVIKAQLQSEGGYDD